MNISTPTIRSLRGGEPAFTRIDLLFVLVPLALLAVVVLPAVADIQNKGGRADCANNLRQIGQDSMIYAGENNGWLPVCTLGAGNQNGTRSNYLEGVHYTRYAYIGGTPHTQITTNEPPIKGSGYQNLGYLYQAGLAGNGGIFFCPAMAGFEQYYEPLLTTDPNGIIQSSYFYNPRMVNAYSGNILRRYQTTSQMEPHRLFAVDFIIGGSPTLVPHGRDHGWNVLFTDGSVQFAQFSQNNNYFYNLVTINLYLDESQNSYISYDETFNALELDH